MKDDDLRAEVQFHIDMRAEFPQHPAVPLQTTIRKRPPPPQPPPTWEEFVAKVNTFGDGRPKGAR